MSVGEFDPFTLGGDDPDRKPYETCPSGPHHAFCVLIWDVGTHDERFENKMRNDVRSIVIGWELPEVLMKDGTPFVITKQFGVALKGASTFGAPNSGLRKMMEAWRGKNYTKEQIIATVNLRLMLSKRCTLTVRHKEDPEDPKKIYHEYGSVSQPMKVGPDFPAVPFHAPIIYTLADGDPPEIDWIPRIFGKSIIDLTYASKEMKAKYPKGRATTAPGDDGFDPAPMTNGALDLSEPESEPDF
jgi:hypothetical protein